MGKTIVSEKTLGVILLVALAAQYIGAFNLPLIGKIAILIVAIILLLK